LYGPKTLTLHGYIHGFLGGLCCSSFYFFVLCRVFVFCFQFISIVLSWLPLRFSLTFILQGRIQGGVAPPPRPPPPLPPPIKLEKIWFFGVKSWFFTRNTPKISTPPSARQIIFKCAPPNLKSWIRPSHVHVCLVLLPQYT
jgi:hypothetical protein